MHTVDGPEPDLLRVDSKTRRRNRLATAFLVCFAVLALILYLPQVVAGVAVLSWPTTQGRVISQTVAEELSYVQVGRSKNYDVKERRLRVRYAYAVNGVPYVAASIGPVRPYVHAYASERERLAKGSEVTVHYNASDPSEAVLDAAVPSDALVGCLLGAAGLALARRRTRRRDR